MSTVLAYVGRNLRLFSRDPLGVFFAVYMLTNKDHGIIPATVTIMIATLVALAVSWHLFHRLPIMPMVSGVVVLIFGALTLIFNDDNFIMMKPTIVNALFGAALLGGLAFGRPLLQVVFDSAFDLDETGWKKLTFRWAIFFFVLAVLNEIVWRTQTTDTWVNFKVFGIMPLTLVFALAQTPLLMRYEAKRG